MAPVLLGGAAAVLLAFAAAFAFVGTSGDAAGLADDAYSVDEDGSLVVVAAAGVLANDTAAEEGQLSASLAESAEHGLLSLNIDGSFTYTPDPDFHGADAFRYRAEDGSVATVTIEVAPVNDGPSPAPDAYNVDENGTLAQDEGGGVLANDLDADQDALRAELRRDARDGALTLSSDGSFSYVPDRDFGGSDSFTYRAFDGTVSRPTDSLRGPPSNRPRADTRASLRRRGRWRWLAVVPT